MLWKLVFQRAFLVHIFLADFTSLGIATFSCRLHLGNWFVNFHIIKEIDNFVAIPVILQVFHSTLLHSLKAILQMSYPWLPTLFITSFYRQLFHIPVKQRNFQIVFISHCISFLLHLTCCTVELVHSIHTLNRIQYLAEFFFFQKPRSNLPTFSCLT